MSAVRGPLTIFGHLTEEWAVRCDGCGRRRMRFWDLQFCGTDFVLCGQCFAKLEITVKKK